MKEIKPDNNFNVVLPKWLVATLTSITILLAVTAVTQKFVIDGLKHELIESLQDSLQLKKDLKAEYDYEVQLIHMYEKCKGHK